MTHATKDQISLCLILLRAEVDISVSKLLGFDTFANLLRVSALENLLLEKSIGFGFGKFGLEKNSWFRKILSPKKRVGFGEFGQNFCLVSHSVRERIQFLNCKS